LKKLIMLLKLSPFPCVQLFLLTAVHKRGFR
jgi:hypothetical protein